MKKLKMFMIALVCLIAIASANLASAAYGMARPADPIPTTSWQIYTPANNWLQVFKTNNQSDGICWEDLAFVKNLDGFLVNNYHGGCTK